MRVAKVKKSDFSKVRKVIKTVFNDGVLTGQKARKAKEFFGELIIKSL